MSNPRERISVLANMLSEHDLSFHWKRCDFPTDLYDGKPFNVKAKVLGNIDKLLRFLCKHEISYAFGDTFNAQGEKRDIRNLWIGHENYQNKIKTKIVESVENIHEEDEMVAFYDAWIQDTKVLIRSAKLS